MPHTTDERPTIVFDFDGTLSNWTYDVTPIVTELFVSLLAEERSKTEIVQALDCQGYGTAINKLFPSSKRKAVLDLVTDLALRQVEAGAISPSNLEDTLETLQSDYKLAIFSARDPVSLNRALSKMGVAIYFDEVEGHVGAYAPKPDPSGFLSFLQANSVSLQKAIYIGDKHVDVIMAREAGVKFIGAAWLRSTLLENSCDHICQELSCLPELIEQLQSLD